jgi:uncharacterized membrane protein
MAITASGARSAGRRAGSAAANIVVYLVARPVLGIGIIMPGLLSALIAATLALVLIPEQAAPHRRRIPGMSAVTSRAARAG